MDIAVIGAGGAVGSEVARLIVSERLLERDQRLLLVGNPKGKSSKSLFGFAVDLMDAYAEVCPQIDVITDPEKINADLIVMAAGQSMIKDSTMDSRDALAEYNYPVFEHYASALAKNGRGCEIVVCISNPNELSVAAFANHLGRKRVIGMGSYLDTLRFRKEIAVDLGIRRQLIHGFMLGEHGANMVPVWSATHVYGYDDEALSEALIKIRLGFKFSSFYTDVATVRDKVLEMIREDKINESFELVDSYPPDIRAVVKPFITHLCGSKTIVGTARATLELIQAITSGHDTFISGQVNIQGEFYGIHGTLGVPLIIGNQGVEQIVEIKLTKEEKTVLVQKAKNINKKLEKFLG